MTNINKSISNDLRELIQETHLSDESQIIDKWSQSSSITPGNRIESQKQAIKLINDIRNDERPALLELFLSEYGLSTDEGVALMCLAEALMRIPDARTMDELIEDKIAPSSWGLHQGKSESLLVNASTWGLMLTGKVLDDQYSDGLTNKLHGMVKRLGEPVIRRAVKRAMKELGKQFVLGETIQDALKHGEKQINAGCTFSYDMLGEAALTKEDANKFYESYRSAIEILAKNSKFDSVKKNPGISIKLSALHPRYEVSQRERVMKELVDDTLSLTLMAKEANMGLNIDAEESDRLDLSLDVIEAVMRNEELKGWDGFGVVVQAYSKRCMYVIDWLYEIAKKYDRKIMVRLVKGAYWDTEIKRAQIEGLSDYPVFTKKEFTDCAYIYCAERLLNLTDRIYPQFATHNANSMAMILELCSDKTSFEFQRLHGMGEILHRLVLERENVMCRIYAPVGPHRDLLAYLVRRLLENGANSSFVNQLIDLSIPASEIAEDVLVKSKINPVTKSKLCKPTELYLPSRVNSKGWDIRDKSDISAIESSRKVFKEHKWTFSPLTVKESSSSDKVTVRNPADSNDIVGTVIFANKDDATKAIMNASNWNDCDQINRSRILKKAADLYEENFGELFAVLTREAGKTVQDAIGELREAVDFLRYYAEEALKQSSTVGRGVFACISPWNFPLAIYTGQIAAALSVGNGVLAKPAETTSICASLATNLLHQAGVPKNVLQLIPGKGEIIGTEFSKSKHINGICFTGSTETAQKINKNIAENAPVDVAFIAETGGLNAMIVDSTALPEQAIKDIISSSFQSAGQRCSALRILYLQEDIADEFMEMLFGAMDELVVSDPWLLSTDIGPVIDKNAKERINTYIMEAEDKNCILKKLNCDNSELYVSPTVVSIDGIIDMEKEIFGPVLHIATFKASEIDKVIHDINHSDYGLTFGLHTRIDDRVDKITSQLNIGNLYVNRNQIGAIVGSQPFGGEGLSGTGPKAGGPNYIKRFTLSEKNEWVKPNPANSVSLDIVQTAINKLNNNKKRLKSHKLPGPTGESNVLSFYSRGVVLCLGPTFDMALLQAQTAKENGCSTLIITEDAEGESTIKGSLNRADLQFLNGFDAVVAWSDEEDQRDILRGLASRSGPIIPLINDLNFSDRCILERHLCIDTTAAGGNAALLMKTS